MDLATTDIAVLLPLAALAAAIIGVLRTTLRALR
jgi:hypothetical protein